jgi:hypothetical protein
MYNYEEVAVDGCVVVTALFCLLLISRTTEYSKLAQLMYYLGENLSAKFQDVLSHNRRMLRWSEGCKRH